MITGAFTIEPKISEESAKKTLRAMMVRYKVARLEELHANSLLGKIMMGTLSYSAKEGLQYELFQSIEVGGERRSVITLVMPDAKIFKDNEVTLQDFNELGGGVAGPETMGKVVTMLLGLPSEYVDKVPLKDHSPIFEIGCLFFLAG